MDQLPITAFAEPTDDLTYQNLSKSQQKAYDVVDENRTLYQETESTLKHGVLIVGSWGSGKSQVLRVMKKNKLIGLILERGQIYREIGEDVELKDEETIRNILDNMIKKVNNIIKQAKNNDESPPPFIALDNPDIPLGSNVTEEAAYRFTWRLLEEATFGRLPYLVVTLNEFTYRKFEEERKHSLAKISQHFDIIFLEWNSDDLERAIRTRLPRIYLTISRRKLAREVAEVARAPRSAIFLFARALVKRKSPIDLIIEDGIKDAFDQYVRILSQSGYKLSKAKSKKWIDVWRNIIKHKRDLVEGLIKREGVLTRELYDALGKDYKVSHWPVTAATRYHIIEKPEPLSYRFTDEFLAASAEYAAGLGYTASGILKNMAELYGRIGR